VAESQPASPSTRRSETRTLAAKTTKSSSAMTSRYSPTHSRVGAGLLKALAIVALDDPRSVSVEPAKATLNPTGTSTAKAIPLPAPIRFQPGTLTEAPLRAYLPPRLPQEIQRSFSIEL
jgi:hypothetical protein